MHVFRLEVNKGSSSSRVGTMRVSARVELWGSQDDPTEVFHLTAVSRQNMYYVHQVKVSISAQPTQVIDVNAYVGMSSSTYRSARSRLKISSKLSSYIGNETDVIIELICHEVDVSKASTTGRK